MNVAFLCMQTCARNMKSSTGRVLLDPPQVRGVAVEDIYQLLLKEMLTANGRAPFFQLLLRDSCKKLRRGAIPAMLYNSLLQVVIVLKATPVILAQIGSCFGTFLVCLRFFC